MVILQSTGLKINNETVDFKIIQPSSPITKNKKTGETLDLEAHPNAQIECEVSNALVVTKTYACEFEDNSHQYNFDAKVINQVHTSDNKYNVSLQAVGKVVVGGKSDAPTISYDNTTFTVSASGDGEVKMYVDGTQVSSPHTFNAVGTYVVTATAEQDGKAISDTVTENITIAKTATPTISYDNTTFTVSASGNGTVTMYVDGTQVSSPHTFDAVGTYVVTATAIETGKFLSDTATENITIAKTATPTISYDNSTYTVSASGNGTVTMYVDGVATVSPHTFTQGQSAVTYTVTATAIETGKFLSDTATESCLVPAASQPELSLYAWGNINETNFDTFLPFESKGDGIYEIDNLTCGGGNAQLNITYSNDTNTWWKYKIGPSGNDSSVTVDPNYGPYQIVMDDGSDEIAAAGMYIINRDYDLTVDLNNMTAVFTISNEPEPEIPTCDNTITLDSNNSFGGDDGQDTDGVVMGCKMSGSSQPGWDSSLQRWVGQSEGSSPNIKYNFCPIAYDFNSELNIRKITFSASGYKSYGYDTAAECEGRLSAVDLSSYYEDYPELEYLHVNIDELTPYQLSNGKYVPQYEITIYIDDNGDEFAWNAFADILDSDWDSTPVFLLSYNRGDGNGTGNWLYLGELANDGENDYYDNQQINVGYNDPVQE